MAILALIDAIPRFRANEDRIDTFVNELGSYTTNNTPPESVETLRSFMIRKETEIDAYATAANGETLVEDEATLLAANSSGSVTSIVLLQSFAMTQDFNITKPWRIKSGAIITTTGHTLTSSGPLKADDVPIFDGTGSVVFTYAYQKISTVWGPTQLAVAMGGLVAIIDRVEGTFNPAVGSTCNYLRANYAYYTSSSTGNFLATALDHAEANAGDLDVLSGRDFETKTTAGTINSVYGARATNYVSGGHVKDLIGFKVNQPVVTGSPTIDHGIGLFISPQDYGTANSGIHLMASGAGGSITWGNNTNNVTVALQQNTTIPAVLNIANGLIAPYVTSGTMPAANANSRGGTGTQLNSTGVMDYNFVVMKDVNDNYAALPEATQYISSFSNSWVNFGADNHAGYWLDRDGVVHLTGKVKDGTVGALIFPLPVGRRPSAVLYFVVNAGGAFGSLTINTSGEVVLQSGLNTFVSLEGVYFRIG